MLIESYGYVDCEREDPDTVWTMRIPWGDGDTAVNQDRGAMAITEPSLGKFK